MSEQNLRGERLKKLKNILRLGINPYPAKTNRKQTTAEAKKSLGKKVAVAGRMKSLRPHGKITFVDLEDESGKIQLFFSQAEILGEKYDFLGNLDLGDFLQAEGEVFKTQAGEITVKVSSYQLLTKSLRPLPSSWYGLDDKEERYRQRYVDLIVNPEVRKIFDIRHKIVRFIRNFLESNSFIEVETPVLQPVYGGATAKPFKTHHNALDLELYLRIADELYLKRLIVAGFEKVFEISKDFRNEGIDRQHNPEFTMLEFYWAYANYEDLMVLTEKMVSQLVKELYGSYQSEYEGVKLDFTPPFPRLSFNELVKKYTKIDLDSVYSDKQLLKAIQEKNIKLELKGAVGFGAIVDELYKKAVRPLIQQPTFIIDYPYEMKPLSKKVEGNSRKSASFQLLVMGYELTNAYNELNDPIEQELRWNQQQDLAKEGLEEYQVVDKDYIQSLEYGMPPVAGFGMGIDRLTAILTGQHSLKEVILFPTLRPLKENLKSILPKKNNKQTDNYCEIDPAVKEKFPGMKVGVAVIEGVKISKSNQDLEKLKAKIVKTISRLTMEDIDQLSSIKAYRDIFKKFGVDWHSRHPSADALLRRIVQGKGLYNINTLVDAYNLAVLETKIALGAFDSDKLSLPVKLRFAKDGEQVNLLGESEPTQINQGELVYSDQERVITLDLNYRDCDFTKITEKTGSVILYADGPPDISVDEMMKGLEKGIELIVQFNGGKLINKMLVG